MSTFLFFLFSIAETFIIYYLMCTMFSFKLSQYWKEALLGSIILTTISYFMRGYSLGIFDVMLQPLLFILSLIILFRIRIFYSTAMSFSFITYVMLQITVIMGLKVSGLIEIWVSHNDFGVYIIQSLSIFFTYILVLILRKYDLRYSFVPSSKQAKVPSNKSNVLLVSLIFAEIFALGISYYWWQHSFNWVYFVCSILMFVIAAYVMKLLNNKEYNYD